MKKLYKSFNKYNFAVQLLITSLSATVGFFIYQHGLQKLEESSYKQFTYSVNTHVGNINAEFEKYNKIVLSIKALVYANPDTSIKYFDDFVSSLNLDKFYPAFSSFSFITYSTPENYKKNIEKIVHELEYYNTIEEDLKPEDINSVKNKELDKSFTNSLYVVTLVQPVKDNIHVLGTPFHDYRNVAKYYYEKSQGKIDSLVIPIIKNGNYIGFLNTNLNSQSIIDKNLERSHNLSYFVDTPENLRQLQKMVDPQYILPATLKRDNADYSILVYPNNVDYYISTLDRIFLFLLSFLAAITSLGLLNFIASLVLEKRKAETYAENVTKDLEKMAWYDSLTGLYNRAYFLQSIEKKIKNNKREPFSLFFIDLDGFKRVNDTLGHHAGDDVLQEYARRLKDIMAPEQNVELARVGGDEFVLYVGNSHPVDNWINKIKKATQNTFLVENHKFGLSQSVGVSHYPKDGDNTETLLRKADMAMYIAKKSDSYDYVIYSERVGQELIERNKMENNLRESISGSELYLLFQPKIRVSADRYEMYGFEALMRWNSPVWGEVGPDKFIPIAEQNGFIDEMTKWLVRESCKTIKYLREKFQYSMPISINLSGRQFTNLTLAQEFIKIIEDENINKEDLILEITESTIMKQPERAKKIIEIYRKNNLKIALDDFGTGYSSFAYLSKFIVDEIKIDKSFIDNITTNESDKALVEAIILMSRKLKLKVVAEGIEELEQIRYLHSIGCDYFQGFHFSRPIYIHQIDKFQNTLEDLFNKDRAASK